MKLMIRFLQLIPIAECNGGEENSRRGAGLEVAAYPFQRVSVFRFGPGSAPTLRLIDVLQRYSNRGCSYLRVTFRKRSRPSRRMSGPPSFVVVDFNHDSRFLLVKTLRRKFASAVIQECDDAEKAIEIARAVNLAAIITHRTYDMLGAELVRRLRDADPRVPIVMVSGIDRESEALAAGANCFLHYDEWLRIGSVVEQHMRPSNETDQEATAGGAVA